jgi:hypothetical protein
MAIPRLRRDNTREEQRTTCVAIATSDLILQQPQLMSLNLKAGRVRPPLRISPCFPQRPRTQRSRAGPYALDPLLPSQKHTDPV